MDSGEELKNETSFPRGTFTRQILVSSLALENWEYLADSRPRQTTLIIFLIDNKRGN